MAGEWIGRGMGKAYYVWIGLYRATKNSPHTTPIFLRYELLCCLVEKGKVYKNGVIVCTYRFALQVSEQIKLANYTSCTQHTTNQHWLHVKALLDWHGILCRKLHDILRVHVPADKTLDIRSVSRFSQGKPNDVTSSQNKSLLDDLGRTVRKPKFCYTNVNTAFLWQFILIMREFPFVSRTDDFLGHASNLVQTSSIFTSTCNWDNNFITTCYILEKMVRNWCDLQAIVRP